MWIPAPAFTAFRDRGAVEEAGHRFTAEPTECRLYRGGTGSRRAAVGIWRLLSSRAGRNRRAVGERGASRGAEPAHRSPERKDVQFLSQASTRSRSGTRRDSAVRGGLARRGPPPAEWNTRVRRAVAREVDRRDPNRPTLPPPDLAARRRQGSEPSAGFRSLTRMRVDETRVGRRVEVPGSINVRSDGEVVRRRGVTTSARRGAATPPFAALALTGLNRTRARAETSPSPPRDELQLSPPSRRPMRAAPRARFPGEIAR